MARNAITPNEDKLKELVLYIADRCADDPRFGAVKLNKLLYLIDAFAYAEHGVPVTGVEYMKQEQGPVPRRFLPIKEEMKKQRWIAEIERPFHGMSKPQKRVIALRPANLDMFTAQEIAHVDGTIQEFWESTGRDLAEMTHRSRGWKIARQLGDIIPYEAAFLSDEPPTEYELAHAEELIAEHGWNVR